MSEGQWDCEDSFSIVVMVSHESLPFLFSGGTSVNLSAYSYEGEPGPTLTVPLKLPNPLHPAANR